MALTSVDSWDFLDEYVQSLEGKSDKSFLSSESIIVCSGPAIHQEGAEGNLLPIGLVQNVTVNQNKNIQQLFEIGSRKPFFVPGRTLTHVGLSRVMFDGPSLLKAVYLRKEEASSIATIPDFNNLQINGVNSTDEPGVDASNSAAPGNPEGTGSAFFINLASSFFNSPLGLGFVLKNQNDEGYGGFYLEECYIQNHSFSAAGQQTVLAENIGIRATRVIPFQWGTPEVPDEG